MTQPAPGVFWEDVFPPPAPTLLTGVPLFIGVSTVADPYVPQRLALWPQFEAAYGSGDDSIGGDGTGSIDDGSEGSDEDRPKRYLAAAVRGFFENDGMLCYVLSVPGPVIDTSQLDTALRAAGELDQIDLICVPDLMAKVTVPWPSAGDLRPVTRLQRQVLDHCRGHGDQFAILDAIPALVDDKVTEHRDALAGEAGAYGALYYPWLWTAGPDGAPRCIPPSGHVAGVYSRSDRRVGVHKAPANEEIEGVLDVHLDLAESQVGDLYSVGVNSLRALPGRGIRVWGARTLGTSPEVRDVNARRLVATVSRWIERFMAGLVYEPNDIRLWVRIMRELTAYLDGLFQRGALRGRTPDEAFFVKCDNETNPSEVIDAGMVVTEVGVAPTVPAEFIVVRVIHGASGVTVSEA